MSDALRGSPAFQETSTNEVGLIGLKMCNTLSAIIIPSQTVVIDSL